MDDTPEHTGLDSPDGTNQQGAAAGAAEEPTLVPQTPPFVCANPNHSSDCVRCVPAPDDADVDEFILVGDAGAKNGEKKLRALLTSRPEWCDATSRDALAAAVDGAGEAQADLALALRTRNVSLLRKRHLLYLARLLRLKSDLWQRKRDRAAPHAAPPAARQQPARVERSTQRVRAAQPGDIFGGPTHSRRPGVAHLARGGGSSSVAEAQAAYTHGLYALPGYRGPPLGQLPGGAPRLLAHLSEHMHVGSQFGGSGGGGGGSGQHSQPPFFVTPMSTSDCEAYMASTLMPLQQEACRHMSGPRAAEAARSQGAPHITCAGSAMCRSAAAMLVSLAQALQQDAHALMLWHDALVQNRQRDEEKTPDGGGERSQGPAWRVLAERVDVASKACATAKGVVFAGLATNRSDRESLIALYGPGRETLADRLWFSEIDDCLSASLDLASRCDALLGTLLFGDAATYLWCASRLVGAVLGGLLGGIAASQEARAAWMDDVIRVRTDEAVRTNGASASAIQAQEAEAAVRSAEAHRSGFSALVQYCAALDERVPGGLSKA